MFPLASALVRPNLTITPKSVINNKSTIPSMKKNLLIGALLIATSSLLAADSSPKDDATAAAKKLADTSYGWKSTMDLGPNSPFTPGPTEGKVADGYTWLS